MAFPTFERLARLFHRKIYRLFSGQLWELIHHPELADNPELRREAWKIGTGMANEVSKANAVSWRKAAMKSIRGREIYEALRREMATTGMSAELERIAFKNASLIAGLPQDMRHRIGQFITEQQMAGMRPEAIEKQIRKMAPKWADSRIRLIARTQISTAETDVTRLRAERLGAAWYQWESAEDSRVRPSHRLMDKVLVAWNEPPAPEQLAGKKPQSHYHAGSTFNCRCAALPVLSLDEISWPARVFSGGSIRRMSRAQFSRMAGMPVAA